MSLASVTPYTAGDASSGTSHTAVMPTVANGDDAILAFGCAADITPTLTPQSGWTSPWTLVVGLHSSGKSLYVYKATNLVSTDSGKTTTISTGAVSTKLVRGILPIRGGSTVDIVDNFATKDGTSSATTATGSPVSTINGGCGALHIMLIRRPDGVAGDWFTSFGPDTGQGLTEDLDAFSGTSASTSSFTALSIAHDWTPRTAGSTIAGGNFTADKTGVHYGVTLSIRPGNIAPTADAGPDIEVDAGDVAHITAAAASDIDGTVASTVWTWVPGGAGVAYPTGVSAPTITGSTTLTPSFPTTTSGAYKLRLTVTDNNGAESTDDVTVWAVTETPAIYEVVNPGGWSPFGTGDPLVALSDVSDSTGIRSTSSPVNDAYTARWQPMPAGPKTFVFDLRNPVASPTTNCTLALLNRDTGTTIATRTETGLTNVKRTVTWVLSPTENGNVIDSHKIDMRWTASS